MKKQSLSLFLCAALFAFAVNATTRFLSIEYKIVVLAKHIKINNLLKIQYDFELTNNSKNAIYSFIVGEKSIVDNEPSILIPDLESMHILFVSPKNWKAENQHLPESLQNSWEWSINTSVSDVDAIQPRSVSKGFSAIVASKYASIFNGFASLDVAGASKNTVIKIDKSDKILPTGLVYATLTPAVLKGKTVSYNVNTLVTAKDNYDPLPEITFDSVQDITSTTAGVLVSPFSTGYTLNFANDITKGVYPTVITIPADAKIAKKYRINYKVTDASDNQTSVSTIVTIPKQ